MRWDGMGWDRGERGEGDWGDPRGQNPIGSLPDPTPGGKIPIPRGQNPIGSLPDPTPGGKTP